MVPDFVPLIRTNAMAPEEKQRTIRLYCSLSGTDDGSIS